MLEIVNELSFNQINPSVTSTISTITSATVTSVADHNNSFAVFAPLGTVSGGSVLTLTLLQTTATTATGGVAVATSPTTTISGAGLASGALLVECPRPVAGDSLYAVLQIQTASAVSNGMYMITGRKAQLPISSPTYEVSTTFGSPQS